MVVVNTQALPNESGPAAMNRSRQSANTSKLPLTSRVNASTAVLQANIGSNTSNKSRHLGATRLGGDKTTLATHPATPLMTKGGSARIHSQPRNDLTIMSDGSACASGATELVSSRVPLQPCNRSLQVTTVIRDIPGKGPGKENVPPRRTTSDTSKKDPKSKPSSGHDQPGMVAPAELEPQSMSLTKTTKPGEDKMLYLQTTKKRAAGNKSEHEKVNMDVSQVATKHVAIGVFSPKEVRLITKHRQGMLHHHVTSPSVAPSRSGLVDPAKVQPGTTLEGLEHKLVLHGDATHSAEKQPLPNNARSLVLAPQAFDPAETTVILTIDTGRSKQKSYHRPGGNSPRLRGHQFPSLANSLRAWLPHEILFMVKEHLFRFLRLKDEMELARDLMLLWTQARRHPVLAAALKAFLGVATARGGSQYLLQQGEGQIKTEVGHG